MMTSWNENKNWKIKKKILFPFVCKLFKTQDDEKRLNGVVMSYGLLPVTGQKQFGQFTRNDLIRPWTEKLFILINSILVYVLVKESRVYPFFQGNKGKCFNNFRTALVYANLTIATKSLLNSSAFRINKVAGITGGKKEKGLF